MTRLPAALLLLPLLLAGCTGTPDPQPAPVTAEPDVEATASASPTPVPTVDPATARLTAEDIPTDCRQLVSAQVYESTFGEVPLNDPALVAPEALPYGDVEPVDLSQAGTDVYDWLDEGRELFCHWANPGADVSRLVAQISVIDPATTAAEFDRLADEGYDCGAFEYGQKCQLVGEHPEYPVTEAQTYYVRGDVVVWIYQANVPTDNLLGSIIDTLWSA